jgi:hypothetical protein
VGVEAAVGLLGDPEAVHLALLDPLRQNDPGLQVVQRDVGLEVLPDRPGQGREVLRQLHRIGLRGRRGDHAALPPGPVVVVGGPPGPGEPQRVVPVQVLVRAGPDPAAGGHLVLGTAADRQVLVDVDGHAADRGHEVPEAAQVEQGEVVDVQAGDPLDQLAGRGQPGIRHAREVPAGRLVRGLVDGVEPAQRLVLPAGAQPGAADRAEPVRVSLRSLAAGRERRPDQVARDRHQHGVTGLRFDAGQHHAVRAHPGPVVAGVTAGQQHVHPLDAGPRVGGGRLRGGGVVRARAAVVTGEHRGEQVALDHRIAGGPAQRRAAQHQQPDHEQRGQRPLRPGQRRPLPQGQVRPEDDQGQDEGEDDRAGRGQQQEVRVDGP